MTTQTSVPPPEAPAGSGATFRRWRGIEDIDGMAAANARLRERVGALEPIEAESMRHHYTHLVNSDPAVDCLVLERDGETRGYARTEWHNLVDGDRTYDAVIIVEPSCWGLGLAGALIRWAEARSAELAAANPTARRSHLANYVLEGDEELGGALLAAGYEAVRWDAEMLRPDLDDLPSEDVPDGYELRAPEESELVAVHDMNVVAFAEHWGEHEATDFRIEEWIEDPRFRRDLVVVAWRGGHPAACVTNLLEDRPDGSVRGLLDGVATHPDHRRRGLARACIARSLRILRAEGASSAYLGVDTDNHNRALALYESCGFRKITGSTSYRRPLGVPEETS